MSIFADMMDAAVEVLEAVHGESMGYTPFGGSLRTITGVKVLVSAEPDGTRDRLLNVTRYKVTVENDAATGVSAPRINKDTMTIDGDVYTVVGGINQSGAHWLLTVERSETDQVRAQGRISERNS